MKNLPARKFLPLRIGIYRVAFECPKLPILFKILYLNFDLSNLILQTFRFNFWLHRVVV